MTLQTLNLISTRAPGEAILTGRELYALGNIGPTELRKGRLIKMNPTGYLHGIIELKIGACLSDFVQQHNLGHVLTGEVGLYTARNPDSVRAADVAYISHARMARVQSPSYLDVAPELIVEIMSPEDRWSAVMEKLDEYFAAGVQAVWIAEPKSRSVYVYRALDDVQHFTEEATLPGGDVLPGFEAAVSEFFPQIDLPASAADA